MGSDRLIQAGLDVLLADVDSPSLPLLAGLARREETEAPELFDQVLDELGLSFEPPADPTAAQWAPAFWLAEEITDGSLDPATGAELIWTEVAEALDYPEALQPTVVVDPEASNGALAEFTRFELVRGCPQHAFQLWWCGAGRRSGPLTCVHDWLVGLSGRGGGLA